SVTPPDGCREPGAACTSSSQCYQGNCQDGVCQGLPLGANCTSLDRCQPNAFCDPSTGLCTAWIPNGDNATGGPIGIPLACASGWIDVTTEKCAPFPSLFQKNQGGSCDPEVDAGGAYHTAGLLSECAMGLFCDSTTSTCTRDGNADGSACG